MQTFLALLVVVGVACGQRCSPRSQAVVLPSGESVDVVSAATASSVALSSGELFTIEVDGTRSVLDTDVSMFVTARVNSTVFWARGAQLLWQCRLGPASSAVHSLVMASARTPARLFVSDDAATVLFLDGTVKMLNTRNDRVLELFEDSINLLDVRFCGLRAAVLWVNRKGRANLMIVDVATGLAISAVVQDEIASRVHQYEWASSCRAFAARVDERVRLQMDARWVDVPLNVSLFRWANSGGTLWFATADAHVGFTNDADLGVVAPVLPVSSAVSIMASVGSHRVLFGNAVDNSILVFHRDTFQVQRVPIVLTLVRALFATPEVDLVVLQASRDAQRSIPELWLLDPTRPTLEPTPLHAALSINGQRAGDVVMTKTHVLFIVTLAAGVSELWVHPYGSASRRISRGDDRVTHFSVDPSGIRVLFTSSISPYLSSACLIAPISAPVAMGVLQVPADLVLDAGTTYSINDTTRVEVDGVAYLAGALKVFTNREGTIYFLRAGFISGSFSR